LCHGHIGHESDEIHAAKDEKEDVEKDNPATYHSDVKVSFQFCCDHWQRAVAIVIVYSTVSYLYLTLNLSILLLIQTLLVTANFSACFPF
jgi:Ca2+-dependent lipid-binding protein